MSASKYLNQLISEMRKNAMLQYGGWLQFSFSFLTYSLNTYCTVAWASLIEVAQSRSAICTWHFLQDAAVVGIVLLLIRTIML